MACLDMYNSEHKSHHHHHHHHQCPPLISPRISFSNDFADSNNIIKQERISRDSPVSSDFEFSVSNHSMISADELFSKGRLLPFKNTPTTTLREELLMDDDDHEYEGFSLRPPKGWKGFLGFRKSHIGSKKTEPEASGSGGRRSRLAHEGTQVNKASQEGGSCCRDMEIGNI